MAEASATTPAAAPTASPADQGVLSREFIDSTWAMTPEQASTALSALEARARPAAPLKPTDARSAAARLAELSQQSGFLERLQQGHLETTREWKELTALAATGIDPGGDLMAETMISEAGEPTVSGRGVISAAADLRSLWSDEKECEGAIAELLDPNARMDPELVEQARAWREEAMQDQEFVRSYLNADRAATKRMRLWNAIIAIGSGP
jgi:hypothetical protein